MENRVFAGRYRVIDKVGTGGMAEVFKAYDEVLGRPVAVKVMLPQFANDPTFTARFRQEAQAAANLSSPYIVSIYDWGQDEGTYFIVMEYVHGIELKRAIKERGKLDQRKVAEIGAQVCSALSVAHSYDIIHRDIKPQNIMVQTDGNIKVMDFGIARAKNSSLTTTNSVLGTAHYVSPEQAQGKTLTYASDLYSLGIVMYESVTGRLPFDAPDAVSVAMKQVSEMPVPPSRYCPELSPTLESIIMRAMSKNPADRFTSATDMKNALNSFLSGIRANYNPRADETAVIGGADGTSTIPIARDPTAVIDNGNANVRRVSGKDTAQPKKRKWPIVAAILAVLAVVGIIAGVIALSGSGDKATVPSVTGMTQADAEKAITSAGFAVGDITEENSVSVSSGNVISQTPKGQTSAQSGSKISIVVSIGPAETATSTVPSLSGLTEDEATTLLAKLNLSAKYGGTEYSSTVEAGKISSQKPAAESTVDAGSTVTYWISLGVENVTVPSVVGKSEAEATSTLKSAGFEVETEYENSDEYASGMVSKQSTTGNAAKGSTITITVSQGPAIKTTTVPNFYGMTWKEASSAAAAKNLSISPSSDPGGTVDGQGTDSGTTVNEGTTITLSFSTPQPTQTTSTTSTTSSSTTTG